MASSCQSRPAHADRLYRYRPSPNRQYNIGQPSPTPGTQMMYSYGNLPPRGQQQPQTLQQMPRPSPPQPTWEVPQTHNSYYAMPRGSGVGGREGSGQLLSRTDVPTSQSLAEQRCVQQQYGCNTFACIDRLFSRRHRHK
jgi:hypothetical protein